MSRQVTLYGFIRKKEGLRTRPDGVHNAKCTLIYTGEDTAAVVSLVREKEFQPNPQDLVRHEEVIQEIFKKQVILPAKFPKILSMDAEIDRQSEEHDRPACAARNGKQYHGG